jgi:hypothetical protein
MKFFKRFFRNLAILIGILIVLALINRRYLGGFDKLEIQEQAIGPYTMAYVEFVGEYSKIGPSMDKVYMALSGVGILSYTGIGIYYDDPEVIAAENLRSDIGAIIDTNDIPKLDNLNDIKVKTIPQKQSVLIAFPLKSSVSYMAGVIKVYPALKRYIQENGFNAQVPVIELYGMAAKQIYYIVEIQTQ